MSTKGSIDKTPANRSEPEPALLQAYGIGIDTHRDFIQVRVLRRCPDGSVQASERAFDTTWPQLKAAANWALQESGEPDPTKLRYCIESTGTYHCPVLLAFEGHPSVVNPVLASPTRRKTDVLDARLLARQSITAMWPESYVPPPGIRDFRVLRSQQVVLRQTASRICSRLNGWILRFGFTVGRDIPPRSRRFAAVLHDLSVARSVPLSTCPPWPLPALVRQAVATELERLESLEKLEQAAKRRVLGALENVEVVTDAGEILSGPTLLSLLQTVPGVGMETALEWIAHVSDVRRFQCARQCVAYCGCDPSLKISAGKVTSHTRRKGNRTIAAAVRIAASAALRGDTKLGRWGRTLQSRHKRGGWKRAVSAVGRRLVEAMYHVQRTATDYDESRYELPEVPLVPCEGLQVLGLPPAAVAILQAKGFEDTVTVTAALWAGSLNNVKGLGDTCLRRIREWVSSNRVLTASQNRSLSQVEGTMPQQDSSSEAKSSVDRTASSREKRGKRCRSSRTASTPVTRSTRLTTGKSTGSRLTRSVKKSSGR